MEDKLEIINIFSKDLDTQLTIRQISIQIKKSYAYTNNLVRKMISDNLIHKKIVGRAILCTLNFKNEETILLLALNSAKEKHSEVEGLLKEKAEIVLYNPKTKKQIIVSETIFNLENVLTLSEFKSNIKEIYKENIVVFGFERYWQLMGYFLK